MLLVDVGAQSQDLNPGAWTLMCVLLTTTVDFRGLFVVYMFVLKCTDMQTV